MQTTNCVSTLYDIITVIISIADVSTDIIVLLSFYYKERTIFFNISLTILCIAQLAYSAAFMWRYDALLAVYDKTDSILLSICFFFVLLPFGPIIPIIIFLTDSYSCCLHCFESVTTFTPDNNFHSHGKSDAAKWMIEKLNKHIGFIIEAGVEAFPQSLLQICAIVYYKEANYISIASILLSMISVMTKSLVFSKGIEMKTFIWTWFCVVVDFFGIFFTLSWVFYSDHDLLPGYFLGYFTFIGELWMYKALITVVPFIVCILSFWCAYYLWFIVHEICESNVCYNVCVSAFWIFCGTTAVVLFCAVAVIALEVFCFTFIAILVYIHCTKRWTGFESHKKSQIIKDIIHFITDGSNKCGANDRVVRILAMNYAINIENKSLSADVSRYVYEIQKTGGIQAIRQITYSDIRNNCDAKDDANIFPALWREIKELYVEATNDLCKPQSSTIEYYEMFIAYIGFAIASIAFPAFVLTKIFQILFPCFIIAYLYHENHGSHGIWHKIDTFQLVMLFSFIGLEFVLLILGIMAMRINYFLWHICPGNFCVNPKAEMDQVSLNFLSDAQSCNSRSLSNRATEWYHKIQWYPQVQKVILDTFGADIAQIVLYYVQNIELESA